MAPSRTRPSRAGPAARLGTVRVRTTLAAAVVVGAAAVVGGVAMVSDVRGTLTRDVVELARHRAAELSGEYEAGVAAPRLLGVAEDTDDIVIQVLGPAGEVVAASGHVDPARPMADVQPGDAEEMAAPPEVDEGHPFLVVAARVDAPGGPRTVLVAQTLEEVDVAAGAVRRRLVVGIPVLVLVVAVTAWKVTGRALAPVDAIRREVDAVSAAQLHRRVPTPAGDDEIARLAATMNRMLDRLEAAQVRQRRFISDASHELRSPVATIRQHAEVALAHPDRADTADLAGTVLAEDLRLQQIVEDLLLLARLDERNLPLRRRPVDLDDLVFDEAGRLRSTTTLVVETRAVSGGRVEGDAALLRRIVRNIADNARRHARGRVAFSLAEADGTVLLAVDDDGAGVPPDERSRVFERFVRLDEARTRDEGGAGLGLAIVADLAATHRGTATMTASPLGGARLEIRLPLLSDDTA